jgi:peptidoglycan/xylan/chitin deacetylase (PgdA/CDA1 family)
VLRGQCHFHRKVWPIDESAKTSPALWQGWPEQKKFALVLTHDVETVKGVENCKELMMLESLLGFRSSFNFVPERYTVPAALRHELTTNGFEVGVHGLNHDGTLYRSRKTFRARAARINHYIEEWQAAGFRSPAMHHNLDWIHDLNIEYDASTFDTDPFEPQSDGVRTIFPFWVHNGSPEDGYVELPYTLPQDFTLFVLMGHENVAIWQKKLDWIAANRGMALLNVHPDYMNFTKKNNGMEEYPSRYYQQFLEYIKERYDGEYWHALPKEVARLFNPKIKQEFQNSGKTNVT